MCTKENSLSFEKENSHFELVWSCEHDKLGMRISVESTCSVIADWKIVYKKESGLFWAVTFFSYSAEEPRNSKGKIKQQFGQKW